MKYFFIGIYRIIISILVFISFPIILIFIIGGADVHSFLDKLFPEDK